MADRRRQIFSAKGFPEYRVSDLGYNVILAASGEEAIQRLQNNTVDLLFTDIVVLGGMSSLELVECFHRLHPNKPALMTTGYNDNMVADIPRGTQLDVIGKTYRREELADHIRIALDQHSGADRTRHRPFGPKEG